MTDDDVEMALEAVQRVPGQDSERAELWDDADEPEWRESLDDLVERLRAALRYRRLQAGKRAWRGVRRREARG
ncbi:hypothetical protein [Arthrobacter sp. 135MFCol5.1]|uniref:hypothetical protein n=1 Tax=Arthrobacter sp. 135MFCol5.1 TaxID=1158050 RepID=UPI003FA45FF0